MNITIDIIDGLNCVIKEVKQEGQADTRYQGQNECDYDISQSCWAHRSAR